MILTSCGQPQLLACDIGVPSDPVLVAHRPPNVIPAEL